MQPAEEIIREQQEALRASAQDMERWKMVHSLIHEMRSVLTATKIGAEVLAGPRADDTAYRRGYAEMIGEQTGRVARLLEDFSELTRPTPAETPPGEEIVDLNVALDSAGRELSSLAAHLEQILDLTPSPVAALIGGHQGRVTQALRALIEYFLVSSPPGSRVVATIGAPAGEAEAVTVSLSRSSPESSGTGEQALDWSRISPAAARRIVEQHGGSLEAAEGEGGLGLVVTFPRERATGAGALSGLDLAATEPSYSPRLRMAA